MDEFKKPYEYTEETGVSGMLLILFFMLIVLEPFLAVIAASLGYLRRDVYGVIGTIITCAAVIYGLFSLFAGIALKKKFTFSITLVKSFLVSRVIFLIPFTCLTIFQQISEIPFVKATPEYAEVKGSLLMSFIIDIAYVIVFSVGWYIYLKKSKRVKELLNEKKVLNPS